MPLVFLPNPGQTLGETRDTIRNNFVLINDTFDVDHEDFTLITNFGKHKFCHLRSQSAAPTTNATEGALYTETVGGNVRLCFKRQTPDGEITCLTGPGSVTPNILSGTLNVTAVTSGTANLITAAIPANTYGEVFLFNTQLAQKSVQMGTFVTPPSPETKLYTTILTNPFPDPLVLVGSTSAIELKVYTTALSGVYNWKVHYWTV